MRDLVSEDDRLIKALAHANYKTTIVQQRENLKLRYANALLHAHNGGIFTVTPALFEHGGTCCFAKSRPRRC